MLSQDQRVRTKTHFNEIFTHGKKAGNRYIGLWAAKSKENASIGFITSKKIGNAVLRNKVKRQLREIYRDYQDHLNNIEFIWVARPPIATASYDDIKKSIQILLKKQGLWQ